MLKQLIPVAALVVLVSTPANAASVKDTAKAAESAAKQAVTTFVVKPAKAAKTFVVTLAHTALTAVQNAVSTAGMAASSTVNAADQAVTDAAE